VIYQISHVTTFVYETPVSVAACALRLSPLSSPAQEVVESHIEVTPPAARRSERTSFEGTRTLIVTIETPHRELQIAARSRVKVDRGTAPVARSGAAWEEVRDSGFRAVEAGPSSPVHHLFPSRLVTLTEPITAYARSSFPPGRGVLAGGVDLMLRIRSDFMYDRSATQVSTPLQDAFARRRGVCQDFAHVMIAGLRGLGLPAAYVSGYLRTHPAPGRRRLEGADATHAWVDLWCGPDLGWVGLDPTNGLAVENEHVVLAIGRDYADVSPIDGIIRGVGTQQLRVAVDVHALA
jgi:transglutaminase-like putative cysteine protease